MSRHLFLADAQREAIETAHFHLDDREIARYWTLSEQDLFRIDRRRRDSDHFGFAVQLCLLRFPGWAANTRGHVPVPSLRYIAEQLEIPAEKIAGYFRRRPTRSKHLQEIVHTPGAVRISHLAPDSLAQDRRTAQHRRAMVEWSTDKPRSIIITSRLL